LAMVMTGIAPLTVMNKNESLVAAFSYGCPGWISVILSVGSITGLAGTVSAALMSEPRIFYSMAVDRLIPPVFMQINPKTNVPEVAVLTTCGLTVFITLFFDVQLIGNLVSLNGLLISSLVDISVVVARYDSECTFSRRVNRCCAIFYILTIVCGLGLYHDWPLLLLSPIPVVLVLIYIFIQSQIQINIPRNFSCPCVPLVPLLGAASFLLMSGTVEGRAWLIFGVCNVLAIISYVVYGYKQSKLNRYRKESLASVRQVKLPEHLLEEVQEKLSLSDGPAAAPEDAPSQPLAEIETAKNPA
jgi:amino acid transporter